MFDINLLDWRNERRQKIRFILILIISIILASLYTAYFTFYFYIKNENQKMKVLHGHWQSLYLQKKPQIDQLNALRMELNFLKHAQNEIEKLQNEKKFLNDFLTLLARSPSNAIRLTHIQKKVGNIQIKGESRSMVAFAKWLNQFPNTHWSETQHLSNTNSIYFLITISKKQKQGVKYQH